MSEWQPIETAPKGVDILVCATYSGPVGGWETTQWVDWHVDGLAWPIFRERFDIPMAPTRWMPLPAPPTD